MVLSSWNADIYVLKSLMEAWEGTYGVAESEHHHLCACLVE